MTKIDTSIPRFWAKIQKTDTCWLWTGRTDKDGYGVLNTTSEFRRLFSISSADIRAHRFSYILAFGTISSENIVRHKCDNPPCVRPDHFILGTRADNMADMDARGRRYSKLTKEQVIEIRHRWDAAYQKIGLPQKLAKEFNVDHVHIRYIVKRKTWKNI